MSELKATVRKTRRRGRGLAGWNIKMLRSAPARTREGGRRRSAPGLQLNLDGPEGFATMKLFYASAACDSKLRLRKYERTNAR
jgi:hypothetical protein